VAYFDQMRAALDLERTLADTISPGSEWIEIAGARKHVMSYLSDFLFSPARANSPVKSLSGGERNRLLLARLLARPANVLVLDEPTNDLDIETLELLEVLLQDYPGTVFLVSHDRRFLDAVVTSTLVSEGAGSWREYEGGVEDWLTQSRRAASLKSAAPSGGASAGPAATSASTATSAGATPAAAARSAPTPAGTTAATSAAVTPSSATAKRKLSFREQRELDELPGRIEKLEAEQKVLGAELAGTELYTRTPERIASVQTRYEAIEMELLELLERWELLGAR
jgi:ATP-binding cassette subfamily F protein uup